ncbi:MAG: GTP cyclohydrolase I [Alcaligenaceae bacterium]|nr:GTP cyclohydrolase I [Alcaligenaceae bacterium]
MKNDSKTPISQKIRDRLIVAGQRYHANDNIADYIEAGELTLLEEEVREKFKSLLESMVIDVDHDHNTEGTPKRVAKMFMREVFRGRYEPIPKTTEFANVEKYNELIIVGPIQIRSACSHHFCPILGKVWIGVMPNENSNLIGLSKYARFVSWIMERPQIQEEAVKQLADLLCERMNPEGLAIVMKADHFCMQWRGVKDLDAQMSSSLMRGAFLKSSDLRKEFLSLLRLNADW